MRAISSHWAAVAGFTLLAVAVLAIDRRARRPQSRLVGFAAVVGRLMATRTGRIGVLVVWWWLGWHFLAR